jgi:general secretion pathway protein G
MRRSAFTLIELIVVIAIVAILAAIVAPNAFLAVEKSKISRAAQDMHNIKTAAMSYYTDTGVWPMIGMSGGSPDVRSTGRGFLNDNNGAGVAVPGWEGPYLEKWPLNPWGQLYYWDADLVGDDNANGIVGEAQVIMFNIPRKSALILDQRYDNGVLFSDDPVNNPVRMIYQNRVVHPANNTNPVTINWMIKEPIAG